MLPCSACILACAVAAALAITWCWWVGAPVVVMLLRDRQPVLLPPPPLGVGDFFWYGLRITTRQRVPILRLAFGYRESGKRLLGQRSRPPPFDDSFPFGYFNLLLLLLSNVIWDQWEIGIGWISLFGIQMIFAVSSWWN